MSMQSKRQVANESSNGPTSKSYSEVRGGDIKSAAGTKGTPNKSEQSGGGGLMKAASSEVIRAARNTVRSQNDTGMQAVGLGMEGAIAAAKGFGVMQKASPYVAKGVVHGVKGIANGVGEVVHVSAKINDEVDGLISGRIKIDSATLARYKSAAARGIMTLPPIKQIITVGRAIHHGAVTVKTGVVKSYRFVRGVINGTAKIQITKEQLDRLREFSANAQRKAIRAAAKKANAIAAGAAKATGKGLGLAYTGLEGTSAGSDDTGMQALALAMKSGRYAAKGIQTAPAVIKASKRAVRTAAKTAKSVTTGIKTSVSTAKKFGMKEMLKYNRNAAGKALAAAGKAALRGAADLLKGIAFKALIPLLLCVVVVVVIMNIAGGLAGVIGALFGGGFSIDGEEVVIHSFLSERIEKSTEKLTERVEKITDKALNEDGYHEVRIFINGEKVAGLAAGLPSAGKFAEMLEPIYQVLVMSEYDLTPTAEQADALYLTIWDALISLTTKDLPIEYCGDPCGQCGVRHGSGKCPNYESGSHESFTCSVCCYDYLCHHDAEDEIVIDEVTGEETVVHHDAYDHQNKGCYGYKDCKGHKILGIFISIGPIDVLMNKYFLNEIKQLEAVVGISTKQQQRLNTLYDNYTLCKSLIEDFQRKVDAGEY